MEKYQDTETMQEFVKLQGEAIKKVAPVQDTNELENYIESATNAIAELFNIMRSKIDRLELDVKSLKNSVRSLNNAVGIKDERPKLINWNSTLGRFTPADEAQSTGHPEKESEQ